MVVQFHDQVNFWEKLGFLRSVEKQRRLCCWRRRHRTRKRVFCTSVWESLVATPNLSLSTTAVDVSEGWLISVRETRLALISFPLPKKHSQKTSKSIGAMMYTKERGETICCTKLSVYLHYISAVCARWDKNLKLLANGMGSPLCTPSQSHQPLNDVGVQIPHTAAKGHL